jgi:ribonuclease R
MQIIGQIRGTRSGFAFLAPDTGGEDLFIPVDALGGAIHGDRVLATLISRGPHDFRPEAQVDEILERPHPTFTGNIGRLGKSWWVRPDSPLLPERLPLRLGESPGIAGAKILFRVENRPTKERTPIAFMVETLGDEEDARLDPIVIASEFGLSLRFNDDALLEAESAAAAAEDPAETEREDFRGQFVLTIDPEDAKDFDDAVAVERAPDGFDLTVHIADVGFYVAEGGACDREAARRGTSVYFPGSVIPMLPEAISTVAASLGPDTDKKVLSVRMRFNAEGDRVDAHVSRGVMRSRARLHYRQAAAILQGRDAEWPELRDNLVVMAELARLLRRRRFREGGFDLDVPETEMTLGADGVPRRVFRHQTLESHRLIEEFMIAANRAVGEWAASREVPFLYRVHQEPSADALTRFEETARTLMPGASAAEFSSLPRLRRWIQGLPSTPLGRILHRFFLRSLRKAVYSEVDIGHFGLGVRGYCHFTSPIRRYPDLFNHRRVLELLRSEGALEHSEARWDLVRALSLSTSRAEINAEEAGREMTRLKGARFMDRRLGEELAGHVMALTPRGLFIEVDAFPVEGFVAREELPPGAQYDEERMAFVQERAGWELRPGDAVRVQVVRVDLRTRRIDFALVRQGTARSTRRGTAKANGAKARGVKVKGATVRDAKTGRRGRKTARPKRSATSQGGRRGGRKPRRGGR